MSPHPLLAQLSRDWSVRAAEPHPWQDDHSLAPGSYAALLLGIRGDPDACLGSLIQRQHRGDERAGRVIVQAVVGKLVRLAAGDRRLDVGDLVAQLWLVISDYPLGRRPRAIAANLCLDARKQVLAAQGREIPAPLGERPGRPDRDCDDLDAEELLDRAHALGLVPPASLQCLRAVYVAGLRSGPAGEALGMSAEMVRWRTSRAIRTLAAHARELAA